MEIIGLMAAGLGAALDPLALAVALTLYIPAERLLGAGQARWLTPCFAAAAAITMSLLLMEVLRSRGVPHSIGHAFGPRWVAAMYHQWAFIGIRALVRACRGSAALP